jgi:hypothetical protein
MEGVRAGVKVVSIPRAFFREALDLALEAVKARETRRGRKFIFLQTSDRSIRGARRRPKNNSSR